MSEQQQTLLKIVQQIYRDTGGPVSTIAVATRAYMSDRWARKQLGDLARAGAVQRVGQRRGWLLPEAA